MSVSLCISFAGRENEFIPVSGQRTFEEWLVAEVGRKHGFKFFSGPCPLFVWDRAHLEQAIEELMIVCEERRVLLERHPNVSDGDKEYELGNWERIVTRLKQLRDEEGWDAHFG